MSAAPSTDLSLRDIALKAFEASNDVASRIRRDDSKRLLFTRLAYRFGLGHFHFHCNQVGFLPDDRAYIDVDGIRLAAPTSSSIAGLYLVTEDASHSITSLVDLGRILAEENL